MAEVSAQVSLRQNRPAADSNASGGEVASARYWPFGGLRPTTGTLPTDRLFTGQVRDLNDDRFYFFTARYYDATIGKLVQPDTIVPDPKNPPALNLYAYGLNNPLRLVDPSGHDAMDPNWVKAFEAAHGGRAPTQQDWEDYQFSLHHPGTGANGAWTNSNWEAYGKVRAILGRELVAQIGKRHPVSFWGAFGTAAWVMNTHRNINTETFVDGPDGVLIVIGGTVPDNADAWTWGDTIIIRQDAVRRYSFSDLKALLAHEYTHVLQYRAKGFGFMPEYLWDARKSVAAGQGVGGPPNELEGQAYGVQHVYETNPWLPGPWDFP